MLLSKKQPRKGTKGKKNMKDTLKECFELEEMLEETIGKEELLQAIQKYLSTDELFEMYKDFVRIYDLESEVE